MEGEGEDFLLGFSCTVPVYSKSYNYMLPYLPGAFASRYKYMYHGLDHAIAHVSTMYATTYRRYCLLRYSDYPTRGHGWQQPEYGRRSLWQALGWA